MIKNYWSAFKKNANNSNVRETAGKLKVSLISITTGLLLGLLVVWAVGANPLDFMISLLTGSFINEETMNQFIIFSSVFILAGLANAFAFKTGLFNIGVSGQMLAGGGLSMFLSLTVFKNLNSAIAIPLLIIVAMAAAGVVGLFAGWVKTRFNVHEVVTTILLNWIIFYFIKWIFTYNESSSYMSRSGDSNITKHHFFSDPLGLVTDSGWVVAIIIALSAVAIIAVILKITVFGKNLRITGLNKDGAEYAGINVKKSIILSMTISSAIAGLLGVVFYFGTKGFMPSLQTTLPTLGFDGIALALLAFNSPIGIIPVSFLYGLFKIGGINIPDTIMSKDFTAETVSLIFSIIIYAAAVSSLFYRFRPISYIIKFIKIYSNDTLIKLRIQQKKELAKLKNKKEIQTLKKEQRSILSDLHYKLLTQEIERDYKTTKQYVVKSVKNKYKRDISFAKMALHTNLTTINKKKIDLLTLKKEKRDLNIVKLYQNITFSYIKYALSFIKLGINWIYLGLSYAIWWVDFDKKEKFVKPITDWQQQILEHAHLLVKQIPSNQLAISKLNRSIAPLQQSMKLVAKLRKAQIKEVKESSKKVVDKIKAESKLEINKRVTEYKQLYIVRQKNIKKNQKPKNTSLKIKEKESFIALVENKVLKGVL